MPTRGKSSYGVVLCDCKVWLGDGSQTPVDALAIEGENIRAVGKEALDQPGDWPRISLEGCTVMPGLIDSHVHLTTAAKSRLRLNLHHCLSLYDLLAALRQWADTHSNESWIVGSGWDESGWAGGGVLSKQVLDTVVADKPICLVRRDRHSAVLNSLALSMVGCIEEAPSTLAPRVESGELSGIVREDLLDEVMQHLPPVSRPQGLQALSEEQNHLWSLGVVGVHTVERKAGLELLDEFHRQESLGLRLYVSAEGLTARECATWRGSVCPQGMKWYVDGSLGSGTAWMFSSDGGTTGVAVMKREKLSAVVKEGLAVGLNPAVHAIGDRAVHEVLDVYEPLLPDHPSRFFRIEHVQHIDKADLSRLSHSNLVLSVQPCHLVSDQVIMATIPRNESRLDYAYRSMLTHGATLALGTDSPIEPADPWRNIRAAMARCEHGKEPIDLHESLSWPHVLSAYTKLPARLAGWHETGQLAPGRQADLVVVHRDPASDLASGQSVELTMHKGRIVYATGSISFSCDWPTF